MSSEKGKCSKDWKRGLNPVVFFLSDCEKDVVAEAVGKFVGDDREGTAAMRRRRGIVGVCEVFVKSERSW